MLAKNTIPCLPILALLVAVCSPVDTCNGQWSPNQIRSDYGGNRQIQYAPDDPSTRSRLFNLQTGHAGAFYNCDGEEDKRNSPYICWKNSGCDRMHCTFSDVLQWRKDRSEIAQRICDGAGACCAGKQCGKCDRRSPVTNASASCGCASCVVANDSSKAATSLPQPVAKIESLKTTATSGLLSARPSIARMAEARNSMLTRNAGVGNEASVDKECDCVACQNKRLATEAKENLSDPASVPAPVAVSAPVDGAPRAASLLDRARTSRQRR